MNEKWAPVAECPGYEVSTLGRVRSFWNLVHEQGVHGFRMRLGNDPHILKTTPDRHGRLTVKLCRQTKLVSQLVLFAFVGPRPEGMVSCHGQNGHADDSLENLSWGTKEKNNGEDRVRDGTDNRGERQGGSKLTSHQVFEIRADRTSTGRELARRYGMSEATISTIRSGKIWKHLLVGQ